MAKIYVGEEKKFAIELTAPGFSMEDDDFEIEVVVANRSSVKGNKGNTLGDTGLRIFKETVIPDGDVWYGLLDTTKLSGTGELKVIGTAFVPDAEAAGSIRTTIGVSMQLGTLVNP